MTPAVKYEPDVYIKPSPYNLGIALLPGDFKLVNSSLKSSKSSRIKSLLGYLAYVWYLFLLNGALICWDLFKLNSYNESFSVWAISWLIPEMSWTMSSWVMFIILDWSMNFLCWTSLSFWRKILFVCVDNLSFFEMLDVFEMIELPRIFIPFAIGAWFGILF